MHWLNRFLLAISQKCMIKSVSASSCEWCKVSADKPFWFALLIEL